MKLKINDKEYNLTNTAILWKDRFESYTDDDTISFNNTNLDNKYIMTNEMFNCLYFGALINVKKSGVIRFDSCSLIISTLYSYSFSLKLKL